MNKIETKKIIGKIFDYIENGEEVTEYQVFKGHPGLYFFHTKEEFNNLLDKYLNEKEEYNSYDIYYLGQRLIKFLLNKYDSHTKIWFKDSDFFPIRFKIENNNVYVINISSDFRKTNGGELVSINNVPIKQILKELELIICYSTKEYLNQEIVNNILQIKVLKSLPSMDNNMSRVNYQIIYNEELIDVIFEEEDSYTICKDNIHKNYTFEIIDNILIIHYNSCRNMEQMTEFINLIKFETINNNIKGYVVDIRNNGGGDSGIVYPLIDFLTGKIIVTLTNENVFSSGRMALVELKKIGSYVIGTNISTSLNAFGNVLGELDLDDIEFTIKRSSTYWYYDKNLSRKGFSKGEFETYFKDYRDLLEPIILGPDEYAYNTIEDIVGNNDRQLNCAINYIREK